jgi:hypothetical protein
LGKPASRPQAILRLAFGLSLNSSFVGGRFHISQSSSAAGSCIYVAVSDVHIVPVFDAKSPQFYNLSLDPEQGGGPRAIGGRYCDSGRGVLGVRRRHPRAYATAAGEVIWDVDTRDHGTVNG